MIAFIIIVTGIVFLLKNIGIIAADAWNILWPVLLIAVGLWTLLKKRDRGFFFAPLENCFFCGKKKQDAVRYE